MSLLSDVHGTAALLVLCVLLFAEEAGVPVPFAPGEVTLVATGLLVASGAVSPFIAVPLCWLACGAGAWVGFQWARRLGAHGLEGIATRLGAGESLRRANRRLARAGPRTIAISRSIPGLRIYTTLVAGSAQIRERTFVIGAFPAMAVWVLVWVLLGATVGIPATRLFSDVERLLLRGSVLLVVAVLAFTAARHIPPVSHRERIADNIVSAPLRTVLAAAVDVGLVATALLGVATLVRSTLGGTTRAAWLELPMLALFTAVAYLAASRRSTGSTAGESIFDVTYLPRRPRRPRKAGEVPTG